MSTRPLPLIAFALLASLPAARVFAQPAAAPDAQPAPAQPAPVAPAAAPEASLADKPAVAPEAAGVAAPGGNKDTLTVDFPDTDVREILRNVSDLFELNLVMPEALQGRTTIKFKDVTWRQIFQHVLDPVGFTYVEEGNIIKIISKEMLNDEPVVTEVYLINYARAADLAPTINSLVDATRGRLVVDARTNSLVITERPTRITKIRPLIEQLDRATDQVMIESKFVEVTNSDLKNIGVNWASLSGYQLGARGINNSFSRERGQEANNQALGSNTNQSNASNGTNSSITNNITGTQTSGATNTGSVTSTGGVPTATSTSSTTGGITSSTTNSNVTGTTGSTTNTLANATQFINDIANSGATSRTLTAVFSASDFNIVLSALQTLNESKVISNPTIVTLNNSEATINVGEERPIPQYTFNQQTGTFEVNGFDFRPIGVQLKVTPQVNGRGLIKLAVEPEVSQSNASVPFKGDQIPIIQSRKAKTIVQLKDGYTMGIGGMMQSQATNGKTKVPVLGSVPVLGRLFRSDTKNTEARNLIIFITAKSLSADGAPVEQVFDSARVRDLKMTREELPGYRDGSDPFLPSPSSRPATTPAAK